MKPFTDKDLKRLKERCDGDDLIGILDYELPALIARLEAAENSRQAWWDHVHDLQMNTLRTQRLAHEADDAWRKVAGK